MNEVRQEVWLRDPPEIAVAVGAEHDIPELVRYVQRPRPPLVMVLSGPQFVSSAPEMSADQSKPLDV